MLYKAALVNTFGQNCHKPQKVALVRLTILLAGALVLGLFIAEQLSGVVLPLPSEPYLMLSLAVVIQLYILMGLLAMRNILQPASDTVTRLFSSLPLSAPKLWFAIQLPSIVIVVLLLFVVMPPLGMMHHAAQAHPLSITAAVLVGAISAQSILQLIPERRTLTLLIAGILAAIEVQLVSHMNAADDRWLLACALGVLLCALCLGMRSYSRTLASAVAARQSRPVIGGSFTPKWWYIKKAARAETTRLGCFSGIAICAGVVYSLRHYHAEGVFAIIASLLAAAAVADIRSLSKPLRPVEIILRGVNYFFMKQLLTAGLLGIVVNVPLLIVAARNTEIIEVLSVLSGIAIGTGVGLFASTLIAPGQRDVSGQMLATLLCSGVTLALAMTPFMSAAAEPIRLLYVGSAAGLFILFASLVEGFRNPYVWRRQ